MTTTRYPGNPDFHEIPPRCSKCGQFCGGFESENPVIWSRNDNYDLPDTYTAYCFDCAVDRELEWGEFDDREDAERAVLGVISA